MSAATGRFDPASSDIDILVTFEDMEAGGYADSFFGLHAGWKNCSSVLWTC